MIRSIILAATLLLGCSISAHATCEGSLTVADVSLTPEKLALRKGAYEELCKKGGEVLVDSAREEWKGRLSLPDKAQWPPPGNSGLRLPNSTKGLGPTVLVFVVDA